MDKFDDGFKEGCEFEIEKLSEYEKLPIGEGLYRIVNMAFFDGEKFWTGNLSTVIRAVKYKDDRYLIENDLYEFDREVLNKLRRSEHLMIVQE